MGGGGVPSDRHDDTEADKLSGPIPTSAERPPPPPAALGWMQRQRSFTFFVFRRDYFLHFPPPQPSPSRPSPDRLRGYVTILGSFLLFLPPLLLLFLLNGYTCGTSGSKPDSLLTFFFMFHSLQPWQLLHVWQKAFESSGKKKQGGREGGREQDKERVMERERE